MRTGMAALLLALAAPAPAAATEGFAALRAAAEKGDVAAEFALAEAYRTGHGAPADQDAALTWYKRAAAQGHAGASDTLGFLLFTRGDRGEAMPYVERAAARGDPRAFYLLGTAHFNGDYVPRDWPLAYAQMSRAAEAGLPAAQRNLAVMGRYLLAADRAKADTILTTLPPVRHPTATPPAVTTVANVGPPAPPPALPTRSASAPPPRPLPAPQVATAPAAAPVLLPPPPRPRSDTAPAKPAEASRPTTTGRWRVQLGAYGNAGRARDAWTRLAGKVPALTSYQQRVVAAGAMQRLQAGGLPDRAAADALCRKVAAAGGSCLPLVPN